jgi:hypothetical protein
MPPPPTGSLALGSRPATNTVAVQISPPTREAHSEGKGGLSSTTQHLLIAAGSIGMPLTVRVQIKQYLI